MTDRAHFLRPVLNDAGDIQPGVSVALYEPGTTTPITESVFLDNTTTTATTMPHVFANGVISVYLDAPKRVRIGVTNGSNPEIFFDDIDIGSVGGGGGFRAGVGTGSIIGGDLNTPSTAAGNDTIVVGDAATADGTDSIAIGHNAGASGVSMTTVGNDAIGDGNNAVAIGKNAWVDTFSDRSIAVGASAVAKGNDNVVVGTDARARKDSTAATSAAVVVGTDAIVNDDQGTAVGSATQSGWHSVAVGHGAYAPNDVSLALGHNSSAQGNGNVAVGQQSRAWGLRNTAVGQASQAGELASNGTEADYCVAIGDATNARGQESTVVGAQSNTGTHLAATTLGWGTGVGGDRAVAIGHGATSFADDHGVVKVDELEVVPSSAPGAPTTLGLHDNVDGTKHVVGVTDTSVTFDGVPIAGSSVFSLQGIVSGDLTVADHILKPGLRVIAATHAKTLVAHIDTPPTGADVHIDVERWNGSVASPLGTIVIPAGSGAGSTSVSVACAAGDLIRFNTTQVGSTVAGADVNLSVDFA